MQFNWGIIQREIKKFGAEINSVVKEALIYGNHEVIREIVQFLMEFDRKCAKERRRYEKDIAKGLIPEVIPKYPPRDGGVLLKQSLMSQSPPIFLNQTNFN